MIISDHKGNVVRDASRISRTELETLASILLIRIEDLSHDTTAELKRTLRTYNTKTGEWQRS